MSAARGRRGGTDEARELALLLGALAHEGDAIDVAGISGRLGCDREHARHLMTLLLQLEDEGGTPLPLVVEGDEPDAVTLFSFGHGIRGRALRLSRGETEAVLAALTRLGMSQDDPLVVKLRSSAGDLAVRGGEVLRTLGSIAGTSDVTGLLRCSLALVAERRLAFSYQGRLDERPQRRVVWPLEVRSEGGHWYLDAADCARDARRSFRIDRMGELALAEGDETPPLEPRKGDGREVRLVFREPALLDEAPWPGLRVCSTGAGVVEATVPYFGGSWLVRRLCSCGAGVIVRDEALRREVQDHAAALLGALPNQDGGAFAPEGRP
ncbi:WYL domain-containing protein [Olsenella massiliensis]|uniref:WYL domain-containing protein n=1 Tax=Olsenella massiliensis TaxID=1622075 RepID=UPI00071C4FAC|nr:WYL domain-containing protein [Olsenella massiliensis]